MWLRTIEVLKTCDEDAITDFLLPRVEESKNQCILDAQREMSRDEGTTKRVNLG